MNNKYRFCPKCGQQLIASANFCHICGAKVSEEVLDENLEIKKINNKNDELDIPFLSKPVTEEIYYDEEEEKETYQDEELEEYEEELEDEEEGEDNPIITKILFGLIAVLLVLLVTIGIFFLLKNQNIEFSLPFFNKKEEVVQVVEEVKPAESTTTTNVAMSDNLKTTIDTFLAANNNDVTKITSLNINGNTVAVNNETVASDGTKDGSFDLNQISNLTALNTLIISNVNTLTLPSSSLGIKNLIINNSNIDTSLTNINNLSSLNKLVITNSTISNLTNLKSLANLNHLELVNNSISDITALAEIPVLKTVKIQNNAIRDYRPLKNVENVTINNGTGQDSNAYQVEVLVDDLRVRSTPDSSTNNNVVKQKADKTYYYILDEKEDGSIGRIWYKIGNNMWIASEEGTWTKLHNK